ncbi:MAG: Sua5 family C-terminal domain-containing protein, partial [Thermococcus sp.]
SSGLALDLACGLGGNSFFLAEQGLQVDAWDISAVAIEHINTQRSDGQHINATVIDLSSERPTLLRPGGLPLEEIEKVIGPVEIHPAVKGKAVDLARAPGMKYRHYSPNARVVLVEGPREKVREKIEELIAEYRSKGYRVGVMATEEFEADEFFHLGETLEDVAKNLFRALRELDRRGVDVIIAEGVEERGLGLAVMNRLRKASGYRIIRA